MKVGAALRTLGFVASRRTATWKDRWRFTRRRLDTGAYGPPGNEAPFEKQVGATPVLHTLTVTLRLLAKRRLASEEELKALDATLEPPFNRRARETLICS